MRVVENKLSDFIDEVEGARGTAQIAQADAELLIAYAANLIALKPDYPI